MTSVETYNNYIYIHIRSLTPSSIVNVILSTLLASVPRGPRDQKIKISVEIIKDYYNLKAVPGQKLHEGFVIR